MRYNLSNRRYIGSKVSLLGFIDNTIASSGVHFDSVFDAFSGTGVVSEHFLNKGKTVYSNDTLYSNYVFYNAWLSSDVYSLKKINAYMNTYNTLDCKVPDNYFSDTFSHTYFHYNDAKKIGYIRQDIENNKNQLTPREYHILLSSLLYTVDKIANTVGHFEAYLSKEPLEKGVNLKSLNIAKYSGKSILYQSDANKIIESIECDLLYVDPPYNARQYINFYHVLENLAEWKKPQVFGKTLKMERQAKKSKYSWSQAPKEFADLILKAKTKYILVSYNNTYQAKSGASINKISATQIVEILESKGKVSIFEQSYKSFNTGKTDFSEHKEILYLCKVNQH